MSEASAQAVTHGPTTLKRARLIVNPAAFGGASQHSIEHVIERLRANGIIADLALVTEDVSGTDLAKAAVADHVDLVVSAGGDGTVHLVASGLIGTRVPLAILPMGTMNNLAHSLNIPDDLDAACAVIAAGEQRAVDVGLVNGRPFFEVVSVGAEAAFMPLAERMRHHGVWGAVRAVVTGTLMLARMQMQAMTLEINNGRRRKTHAWQVTVCNTPTYGLHFEAAPAARMDDGLVDLVVARYPQRWGLIRHYRSIMSGERPTNMHTRIRQARRVRISAPTPLPVAVDGEAAGTTPVSITVAPHALVVLAPLPSSAAPREPRSSPVAAMLRSIAGPEMDDDPQVFSPEETVRRINTITRAYFLVAPIVGAVAWLAHQLGWWPFATRRAELRSTASPTPFAANILASTAASAGLVAIYSRLRMIPETLGFLATALLGPVAWVGRQIERRWPRVVAPDEATARAVASTGVLAAGLIASRRPSLRRHLFVAALAGIGMWLAGTGRQPGEPGERRRASIALGAGLGAVWLGGSLALLARARRALYVVTHSTTAGDHSASASEPEHLPMLAADGRGPIPIAVATPLERGDILLFGPDGTIGARMIEILTQSRYHHIALYDGDGFVIEAMPQGVRRVPLGGRTVTGVRPTAHPEQRRAAADWARKRVGGHYDAQGLALIAFDRLFPGLRLGGASTNRFSCAVFIADAYVHAGVDLLPGQRWQDLVPGDFVTLLETGK